MANNPYTSRRAFLAAPSLLLSGQQCPDSVPPFSLNISPAPDFTIPPSNPLRRPPASALSQKDWENLSWAYQQMGRFSSDPDSYWSKQRNLHALFCASPESNVHHSPNFLLWHRGLIYFHELKLRQLLASRAPNFRLPRLDWEPATTERVFLPDPYIANHPSTAALIDPCRDGIASIPSSPTWWSNAFKATFHEPHSAAEKGFRHAFETSIHDHFHTSFHARDPKTGKEIRGLLNPPVTAAQDPIFFIFHATIDWMLDLWITTAQPVAPWPAITALSPHYTFLHPDGHFVKVKPAQLLSTHDLGYNYGNPLPPKNNSPFSISSTPNHPLPYFPQSAIAIRWKLPQLPTGHLFFFAGSPSAPIFRNRPIDPIQLSSGDSFLGLHVVWNIPHHNHGNSNQLTINNVFRYPRPKPAKVTAVFTDTAYRVQAATELPASAWNWVYV